MKERILVTIGDPAGCGPSVTLKAISDFKKRASLFVVGDKVVLERYRIFKRISKKIELIDIRTPGIKNLRLGYPSCLGGKASLNYIKIALKIMKEEKISKLVTAPVSKEAIQLNFKTFSGHTEFLADYFKVKNVVMMMVEGDFKVVLSTRHIPLREVPFCLTKKVIRNTIKLTYKALKDTFNITHPKIAITGINPHAGINTFLGKEEKLIKEVVRTLNFKINGPYPSDTLFLLENLKKYDCIIAGYHDQAMIPFKLLFFKKGVNITLGLPIIRTSPVHGTAFDIIKKKGIPLHFSMLSAISLIEKLSL